jgi:hypothetical protein
MATKGSNMRDFLASVASVQGDLSNISAPPFVLAPNSTVEIPQYWADHQSQFVAQAKEEDPEKRALAVSRYFLSTLKNQQYAGRREGDGVKKPINAFLGELFLGSWNEEGLGETRLVSEQVSHHPPITCCYMWNEKHGIRSGGFTEQEITFNGNVNIKQKGYVILHMDKFDEDYLIPVPDIKVKGVLGGYPYPELEGEYSLIGSNGYVSRVKFAGKSFWGSGQKNAFESRLYHTKRPNDTLYTAKGTWSREFSIQDARSGKKVEDIDVNALPSAKIKVDNLEDQDPWESRKAWAGVISSIKSNNMRGVTTAKAQIEEGQRRMRREEEARGEQWKSLFFKRVERDPVFEKLSALDPGSFTLSHGGGLWKVDEEAIKNAKKPYHGDLTPTNGAPGDSARQSMDSRRDSQSPQRNSTVAYRASIDVPYRKRSVDEEFRDARRRSEQLHMKHAPMNGVNGFANAQMKSKSPDQQHGQGVSALLAQTPTDEQVESFLRAKFSNLKT